LLRIGLAEPWVELTRSTLTRAAAVIAFAVTDTGIGIAKDKQMVIFEAFQQADGTTSRKYGGTGLGLSISREIARLLGGEIHVTSAPGEGSKFVLYLPDTYAPPAGTTAPASATNAEAWALARHEEARTARALACAPSPPPMEDDRAHLREGDRVLLVIEDDERFARVLLMMARQHGFKVVVASRGDTGLELANDLQPDAITLDVQLPVLDGWTVLDRLKRSPRTRHIPVHVVSVVERNQRAASMGAFAFLEKPVSREALEGALSHLASFVDRTLKSLLLVEDNTTERAELAALLGDAGAVTVTAVSSAADAMKELGARDYDCMVVDLILPDLDGVRLIEDVRERAEWRDLPIVVYTGKHLEAGEEAALRRHVHSIITKSGPASAERLVRDTSLFLHRVEVRHRSWPPYDGSNGVDVHDTSGAPPEPARSPAGSTVLIIDDDARNIFALASVLEARGLRVLYAENGRAGIEAIAKHPDIDVVLLDVMMPEMDGYETMRAIRKDPALASLPIIAVTAKALIEDREKCVAAGASDYIAKPVDTDKLIELIGLWTQAAGR